MIVADYCDVDPRLGTLDQFDELVPKRTNAVSASSWTSCRTTRPISTVGSKRPWLKVRNRKRHNGMCSGRAMGEHGELPPTNWLSNFGGSAWESCGDGWYYLHLFAKEQPDLELGQSRGAA